MLRKKNFLFIGWIYSKSVCLNHLVIEILYVLHFYLLKTNHKLHIYFIENSRQFVSHPKGCDVSCLGPSKAMKTLFAVRPSIALLSFVLLRL